jgi:hypothetical protein
MILFMMIKFVTNVLPPHHAMSIDTSLAMSLAMSLGTSIATSTTTSSTTYDAF